LIQTDADSHSPVGQRHLLAPPRPGSTTALHTLRTKLDTARAQGEPFAACWPAAVTVALAEVSGRERQEWRWCLERTRSTWERCFLRLPAAPAELALQLIAFDRDEALPDMWCEHCSGKLVQPTVPSGRMPVYCSERCRKDASVARAAERTLAA
jgi:hypothetical protein